MKNHYMEFENNKYCLQGKYYKDIQYNKQHLEDIMKSLFFLFYMKHKNRETLNNPEERYHCKLETHPELKTNWTII